MKQLLVLWALVIFGVSTASADKLTYADLVNSLIDLEQLAVLPVKGETCQQASSYDRASKYDASSGKYVRWDANGDNDGMVREENGALVMADIRGPGCIVRMWSAKADEGHVKIYLDGSSEPAIDLPFIGYFDGKNVPFNYPNLVHTVAQGLNNYVPVPFQRSCKIVAEKGWGAYYQFTYRTFPAGTTVPSFSMQMSAQDLNALKRVDSILSLGPGENRLAAAPANQQSNDEKGVPLKSDTGFFGKVDTSKDFSVNLEGPRAIVDLNVNLPDIPANEMERYLREAVIEIRWDGEKYPSVLAPLGDFFGTGPGLNLYSSLPFSITARDLNCRWFMPFTSANIKISKPSQPLSKNPVLVIYTQPLTHSLARYGRFHAKWHRDAFLPKSEDRAIDWTMLTTQGRGRFVGVSLEVWNPKGGWWGEGDEKFFVDGERFPSTIGTGSEDYFGYAWCNPSLFQNAYHNQTRNDGDNRGHVAVNRWQIADNIPFQTSFDGYIEKYYANSRPTLYASTVYWYLQRGGRDPYGAANLKNRSDWYVAVTPVRVPGAQEAEELKVLEQHGRLGLQPMEIFGSDWSNDTQLWWTEAKPEDTLVLAVNNEKAGRYNVIANLTKAPDYGIVRITFNDSPLGQSIDLYSPSVVASGPLLLGTADLPAGTSKLKLEIVGANPNAVKNYMVGLDYIKLEPVQ